MKTPKKSPVKTATKKVVDDNDDFDEEAEDLKPAKKSQVNDDDDDFDVPLDDLDNFNDFVVDDEDDEDY